VNTEENCDVYVLNMMLA